MRKVKKQARRRRTLAQQRLCAETQGKLVLSQCAEFFCNEGAHLKLWVKVRPTVLDIQVHQFGVNSSTAEHAACEDVHADVVHRQCTDNFATCSCELNRCHVLHRKLCRMVASISSRACWQLSAYMFMRLDLRIHAVGTWFAVCFSAKPAAKARLLD